MELKKVRKSIDYMYSLDVKTQGLIVRYDICFDYSDNNDDVSTDIWDSNIITDGEENKSLTAVLLYSQDRTFTDIAYKDLENQYDLDSIWNELKKDANIFLMKK